MRSRSASRPPAESHGEAGKPGGELDVALGVHPPALAVIDRAHRLLGLVEAVERRVDRDRVAGPDQPLAVLEPLGHRLPVPRLLGQAGQIPCNAGAGLLRGARRLEERLLARRLVAGDHGEAGQHRAARLQEVAVEVADQRVAAPARPDLGEGDGREHAHRDVLAVRVVEGEPGRRDRERPAGRDALFVEGIARRPAPGRAARRPVALAVHVGCNQLGREREQRVRLHPARMGARRGKRSLQCPAERAERGLGRRSRTDGQAGHDEHPVVGKGEGRAARMELAPAAMREQRAPALSHPRHCAPGAGARRRPGIGRGAEPGACPVEHLDSAALGRGIGQRARQCPERFGVDAGEGRQFEHEAGAGGVDVELARFVPGTPGQQRMEPRRHRRRRPRTRGFRPLEQFEQAADPPGRHQGTLQPAGSSTARTWLASR